LQALTGNRSEDHDPHDLVTRSEVNSSAGYTCASLVEGTYNNGYNYLASFMSMGEVNARGKDLRPTQITCHDIPADYVVLNIFMAPFPRPSPSPAPQSSQTLSTYVKNKTEAGPGADTKTPSSSGPPPVPPAAATATVDPKTLSAGTWVGIAASCLVGVSALVAIAYNVWKWRNKRKLVAARGRRGVP
jgi:hypothetical protein